LGEVGERGHIGLGIAEHLSDAGVAGGQGLGDVVELGADGAGCAHGEDRADPGRDHLALALGDLGEHVAHEVDPATLPRSTLQDGPDRSDQAAVGIGDDQLDTGQAPAPQVAEELGPELLGLSVSLSPTWQPSTSRCPSAETPVAITTAWTPPGR
jgi:hypothetical protein